MRNRSLLACALAATAFAGPVQAQTWGPLTIPTAETLRSVHFVSEDVGWAAGYNGVVIRTGDSGANWTPQASETTQRILAVRFVDASTGWLAAGRYVARSVDGGADWVALTIDPNAAIFRNSIFPVSATVAWVPTVCGSCPPAQRWFYRYTIGAGGAVSEQTFDLLASSAQFLDMHFTDTDNGWAVGTSGLIRRVTAASGNAPVFAPQASGVAVQLNGVFMLDANTGWIVGNGGTILATTDGGALWSPQASGTMANLRDVAFRNALQGWAVGEGGTIRVTTDGGQNWAAEDSGVATTLWSVSAPLSVYAAGGDLVASANAVVLKRAAPPDLVLRDGFEDPLPP